MNNVTKLFTLISFTLTSMFFTAVQAEENNYKKGYISDDLFIYMLAGPGTNYKILGTINAGSEIQKTGAEENNYSEIVDEKNRVTWVESKYLTDKAGLRTVVAELNSKISASSNFTNELDGKVNELKNKVTLLTKEKRELSSELTQITATLEKTRTKIKDQDMNIQKQWFFNGALVLGFGLVLGLVIPRFFSRRRASMENWS